MCAIQVRTQALCIVPWGEVVILVRAFAAPWPASHAIFSIYEAVVHLREAIKCCRIVDSQSRPMPVLKMVNKPLPLAPIVGGKNTTRSTLVPPGVPERRGGGA